MGYITRSRSAARGDRGDTGNVDPVPSSCQIVISWTTNDVGLLFEFIRIFRFKCHVPDDGEIKVLQKLEETHLVSWSDKYVRDVKVLRKLDGVITQPNEIDSTISAVQLER